ncbi:MAG: hypothetical protein M3Q71_02705 [Chloroflexota bacterium]|nr:hypothetical protein [Chloroflexota bacterium]MDP9469562.1 hypothetical protein [Chloroflexota bacterium]
MSILHEHKPLRDSTPIVNHPPKYPHLSTRQIVVLLLAAQHRGYTAASVSQAREEIRLRETEGGDER